MFNQIASATNAFMFNIISATNEFNEFGDVLSDLFGQFFSPCIKIAIALCAIWGVYLGIKFWKSGGDENKRKEAKTAVISFVIGIVVIFLVAVAAPILIGALSEWMSNQG